MNKRSNEILNEKMSKLLIKFSIPAIMGMMAIGLYQFVDAIFVGKWINLYALGAISIVMPITLINSSSALLVGIGSVSFLSRAIGEKDHKKIEDIFSNAIFWISVISITLTAILYFFAGNLVTFFGATDPQIYNYATEYLKIIALGSFFVNFAFMSTMLIRGEGHIGSAMFIVGSGSILNIIFDIIAIKYLNMGISGAAWATFTSQVIMFILAIRYYLTAETVLKFKSFSPKPYLTKSICAVGFSAMLMQMLQLVQQLFIYRSVAEYGTPEDTALSGALLRIIIFAFIPLWGIAQSFQPIAGINYGAKKYHRVKKGMLIFTSTASLFAIAAWILFQFYFNEIMSLFLNDPSILAGKSEDLKYMVGMFFLYGFSITAVTFFQSLGRAAIATISVIARQVAFFVPFILFLPLKYGLKGVYMAMPLADIIAISMMGFFLISTINQLNHKQKQLKKTQ